MSNVVAQPAIHSRAAVRRFVHHVADAWHSQLQERLVGVYLIGSLAHGGYSARYSDIDMALIVQEPLATADFDLVSSRTALYSPGLAHKVSLFWADAAFSGGRFPPVDRIDYLDHAVPLLERRRVLPERPTLLEVRGYLSADPLRKWSDEAMRLNALSGLLTDDHKAYLRAVLYPARFLYSWETGNVASNDDAVDYVERRNLAGSAVDLITRALRCRNANEDASALFSERPKLLDLVRTCAECVRATQGG